MIREKSNQLLRAGMSCMSWENKDEHGIPTPVREGGRLNFHAAAKVLSRRATMYLRIMLSLRR